ncbi:hypothetical protein IWQ62_002025, partial [Dispira parvispora]
MLHTCRQLAALVVVCLGLLALTASKATSEKSDNIIPSLHLKFAWTVLEARYPLNATGANPQTLWSCEGEPLVVVSHKFYRQLKKARTGRLLNGKFVTRVRCDGNKGTDSRKAFKMESQLIERHDNPVWPFISLAAKALKPGNTAYIKALDDIDLPLNQTHNGCVQGSELTNLYESDDAILYVQMEQFGKAIMERLGGRKVNVEVKECEPGDYSSYDLNADIRQVPPAPDSEDNDSSKDERPGRSINSKSDDVFPNDQREGNDDNPKDSSADLSSLTVITNNFSKPDHSISGAVKIIPFTSLWYIL